MMHEEEKMSALKEFLARQGSLADNTVLYEDFKRWICTLTEQICTVITSQRSQINPKNILYNTVFLAKPHCLAKHSL